MTFNLLGQLGVFAASALLSLLLVPLAIRVAVARGYLDQPGGDRKRQESATPYLGGVAIVLSFAATLLLAVVLEPPRANVDELVMILGGGVLLGLMGLIDDLRGGLPVWVRLVVMTAAALGLYATGVRVRAFDPEAIDVLVTVVWVVGLTNAMNLLDNMDGLSAGIAVISAAWFFVIAVVTGQFLVGALAAALAGCAIGFLRHNRHPAKIYMGDAGSLFLGYTLAAIGIKLRFDAPVDVTMFVAPLVLAVPITDTTLVVVSRLLNGRSPFAPGRDHLSHRLVKVGLPVPIAVRALYVLSVLAGWAGLVMHRVDRTTAYLLLGLVAAAMLGVAALLYQVPAYDRAGDRPVRLLRLPPGAEDGDLPAQTGEGRLPAQTGEGRDAVPHGADDPS